MRLSLKIYSVLLFVLIVSGMDSFVNGQYTKDYQLWQKADIEAKITNVYSVSIGDEARITQKVSDFSYYFFDLGNYFKVNKKLRLDLDILYINKKKDDGSHSQRWQYNASATYKNKLGRFLLYDRLLTESQIVDYQPSKKGHLFQDFYLRDKLTCRYKINKTLYPYLEDEIYYRLDTQSHKNPSGFNRNRFYAGLLKYFNSVNRLDFFLLDEHNFNTKPLTNNYICGIGYSRDLF